MKCLLMNQAKKNIEWITIKYFVDTVSFVPGRVELPEEKEPHGLNIVSMIEESAVVDELVQLQIG